MVKLRNFCMQFAKMKLHVVIWKLIPQLTGKIALDCPFVILQDQKTLRKSLHTAVKGLISLSDIRNKGILLYLHYPFHV